MAIIHPTPQDSFKLNEYIKKLKGDHGDATYNDLIKTIVQAQAEQAGVEIPVAPGFLYGIPDKFFNDKIERAVEYASIIHEGQKYGDEPYTKHLADVYKVFLEFIVEPIWAVNPSAGAGAAIIDKYADFACAIWLHDSIEDTNTTKDELEELFGAGVADLVWAVSGEGANRKERLASVARKMEEVPDAVIIKLCDRVANTRSSSYQHYKGLESLFLMYIKEFPKFKQELGAFHKNIDFVKQMWQYLESISKE